MISVVFYLVCFAALISLGFALSKTVSKFIAKKASHTGTLFVKIWIIMLLITAVFVAMAEFHKMTGQ